MTRVIGPPKSKRRRWTFLWCLIVVLTVGGLYIAGAGALNSTTGELELDGNATTQTATPQRDDWDRVCYQVAKDGGATDAAAAAKCFANGDTATPAGTTGTTATAWTDATGHDMVFNGGGSKDHGDPQNDWLWASKTAPDKDTLVHGFAARYSSGHMFFGVDRYDNSGDAQLGFWFFQNPVTTTNTASGGGFAFSGHHKNGDLLVISDFSNGGTTANIKAYTWDTTCLKAVSGPEPNYNPGDCADTNVRLILKATNSRCTVVAANSPICGIVNPDLATASGHEIAPWSYLDKGGHSGIYDQGELYEAGIDLSQFPNLTNECFSSVVAESRASDSIGSVLKDFIPSNFGQCSATLATQVSATSSVLPGTSVHDTLTVSSDNAGFTPSGTVTWYLCALATGACDGTTGKVGTSLGTSSLSGSAGTATADSPNVNCTNDSGTNCAAGENPLGPGRYCFRAEWPGDTNFTAGPYAEFGGSSGTNECFTVRDTSSMTTAQNWIPNDSATITAAGGSTLSGNVVFTLYDGTITCSSSTQTATVLYGPETKTLTAAASPATVSTGNTGASTTTPPGVKITSATSKTVTWKVVFTSTDTGVDSPTSPTCETTTLTISN